jgi:hypothetical protein
MPLPARILIVAFGADPIDAPPFTATAQVRADL